MPSATACPWCLRSAAAASARWAAGQGWGGLRARIQAGQHVGAAGGQSGRCRHLPAWRSEQGRSCWPNLLPAPTPPLPAPLQVFGRDKAMSIVALMRLDGLDPHLTTMMEAAHQVCTCVCTFPFFSQVACISLFSPVCVR